MYDQEAEDKKAIAESLRVKQEPIVSKKYEIKANKANPLKISLDPVKVDFTNPVRRPYGYQPGTIYNNDSILNQFDA